jgi:hypothetical protein
MMMVVILTHSSNELILTHYTLSLYHAHRFMIVLLGKIVLIIYLERVSPLY